MPVRSPEKPKMRSTRVELVTRMPTVRRSESRRRNVRAPRSIEATVPSSWRGAALVPADESVG
jgi:hypothetical protein